MTHDVFLSYSSNDKTVADAACNVLERNNVRVWMAPRDIVPGVGWAQAIIAAIVGARVLVLIYSNHANSSHQIAREVERAIHKGLPIVTFRVQDVPPSATLEYFISETHWLDAFTPPLESHLERLADAVKRLLASEFVQPTRSKVSTGPEIDAPEATAPERQGRPRLSMVVLPFANLGGDAEQEHFVDGVTESLTTDLSRIRSAFVIGRNTAFTYKGKAVDLRQIGRELSVRYVLEGSVQRGGNRMRVNVQLIDAETGNHLWAQRFDKPLADLFDMQDEIVARLAGALSAQLVEAEARRAEKAANPDSMDLYFQGLAWLNRGITPDNITQARNFLDRARSVDPNNVEALVASAQVDVIAAGSLFVTDPIAAFLAAEAKLSKALSTVPDHAGSHTLLGALYIHTKRVARGIAECEHALALNRNLATAYAFVGLGKICIGRSEETEAHIVEALRLSPRDTYGYLWLSFAGHAKSFLGLHDEALAWYLRSIEANRNFSQAHFSLAVSLAYLGRLDEAHSAVKAGLALDPSFTVSRARAGLMAMFDDPSFSARFAGNLEGLRMAGVPEQ